MPTITKKELIDRIAADSKLSRVEIKKVVQALLDQVIEELGKGNRIELRDFGILEPKLRAPRMAQNPRTLERVPVPARRTVKFKSGRMMLQSLNRRDDAGGGGSNAEPKVNLPRPSPKTLAASGRK